MRDVLESRFVAGLRALLESRRVAKIVEDMGIRRGQDLVGESAIKRLGKNKQVGQECRGQRLPSSRTW